jgi:pyridoxal phosphate enzyme (YggS family)
VPEENHIRENILRIQERIAAARQRCGRADDCTLIAVSKTQSAESVRRAYQAGIRHFGENRVQEWEGKMPQLEDLQARWHLIGHLQSNKATRAAKAFHTVDSVDDLPVAQRLDHARQSNQSKEKLRILIEVRVAQEDTKAGARLEDVTALIAGITQLSTLEVAGLMCIPPFLEDPDKVRPYFQKLRNLRDALVKSTGLKLPVLSMGMSHDFEVAIEEGATEVRIGTAIFGARPHHKEPQVQS